MKFQRKKRASNSFRATVSIIIVYFAGHAAAGTAPPSAAQNPRITAYLARLANGGSSSTTVATTTASKTRIHKRTGFTPRDQMFEQFRNLRDHSLSGTKAHSEAQPQIDIPHFLSSQQFAATGTDAVNIFASAEGDFNGDGVADIVTLNVDGGLNIFINAGNGVMNRTYSDLTLPAMGGHKMLQLAVGDLNGDGFDDIAALDLSTNQFYVWLSRGDGTVSVPTGYAVAPNSGASFYNAGGGIAIADVTGDSHPDVVAVSADYENGSPQTIVSLQVFPGKGDGTLGSPIESDTKLSDVYFMTFGETIVLADIDGDGMLDAAVMLEDVGENGTQGVGIMTAKGKGKGGFSPLSGYSGAFVAGADFSFYGSTNMSVVDLNQDGARDLVFNDGLGNLNVSLNQGSSSFAAAQVAIPSSDGNVVYGFGDLNGDKIPDVAAFSDGVVSVYVGKGDGTFNTAAAHYYPVGLGPGHQQPALAPYAGGANQALGAVYVSEEMNSGVVLLGNGDGTLQGAPILAPSAEDISLLTVFASGDLDGDGIPDFVAFDYSDVSASDNPNQLPTIVSLISDGKGGLKRKATAIPESYFIQKGSSFIVVEPMAVDLTGDGKADLLLSTGNDVEVAYGNGDGTFQTPIVLNLGGGFATLDCIPGLASAGRGSDGVLEFVVAYGGDNSCRGTGGQASGVFAFTNGGAAVAFTPLGTSLVDAKLTDLNSDGVLDLVTNDSHEESGTFAVYATKGTGDATFDPAETNTIESGYLISDILTGDYNQDGVADLVLASMGVIASGNLVDNTGGVLLLPGNNDGSFGPTTLADGGLPVQAAAWGDFNGDGLPDLAVSQFLGKPYNPYLQYWLEAFSFAVLPNAGDGTFPVSQPFESLSMAPIFVGDYTSNGNADVAVPEFAGSVSLFINTLPSPRLTLSATPSSLALTQGATGVLTIAVAANDAFNGTVNFSCSGAPSESTCTVNPTTFALARGQSASITVVVATTAPNNFYSAHNGNPPGGIGWKDLAGGTQLAVCILCMIPKRTRRKISVLPTLLLVGFLGGCFLCGCGAGGTRQPMYGGTPTGTTTLTITATSGSLMQSIPLPLTVMSNSPGQSMMTTK